MNRIATKIKKRHWKVGKGRKRTKYEGGDDKKRRKRGRKEENDKKMQI